ncbi:amidase [Gracilibacillus thailandensis]|uniref:Amidase n=1 Tax=Gracilibacillus thailandensis TaxID=563735 RepID=A0A6N7QXV9_9BACI|nr:amidase [Gracilibacillus thailandensis]MRI66897.1 amidase [Gracilibacillus thailandensis]
MKAFNDLLQLDALGQKTLLDQKELSVLELTDFYIDRIETYNPTLNAVVTKSFELGREQAKKMTTTKGKVKGLPFLIKDLNAVKGIRQTSGSRMLKDFIAPDNDVIVDRFEHAGLIFLGKTNTPELGFLPTTEPLLFGATKNPWDLERSPGGSSGGSAAAVAAGLIPFAHANDGGGSIRIPASACGLFGFKPSRGRMPYPAYMNHFSINHALTRSVRDSAALLDILNGAGDHQLYPSFASQNNFLERVHETPRKLKIAVQYQEDETIHFDSETRNNMENTVQLMKELGHEVVEEMPVIDFPELAKHFIKIWMGSGSTIIKHTGLMVGHEPSYQNLEPLTYDILKYGQDLSALEYEESRVYIQKEAQKILAFFQDVDVWMTPTMNQLPTKLGKDTDPAKDGFQQMMDNMLDYNPFMPIANATGQPAMSVPTHWTNDGLPVGTHFFGRLGEDQLLLQLASQIEREKPWFHNYRKISDIILGGR